MIKIYRLITIIFAPLVRIYLFWRKKNDREDNIRFKERFGRPSMERPAGKLIWIHGASVGESLSIFPLIAILADKYPDVNFLITTGTVTSAKLIASRLPPKTIHQYVPVDILPYVTHFIKHWHPDLALWVESELWPNLITGISKNCPLIMINGRISPKSYASWQKYGSFIKEILKCFSLCLAQSQHDAQRLKDLGANNVKYSGNIKYDAPALPFDTEKLAQLTKLLSNRPCFIAASTHKNEEKIIAAVHAQLKAKYPALLTIIIPRHPTRCNEILEDISTYNLDVSVRSKGQLFNDKTDIYLADTMGELGIFYRLANIVFIGGSLVQHGGQNPLEAARLGCAIITGPYTFNFVEIKREFDEKNAIITVNDAQSLAAAINDLLENTEKTANMIASAYELVNEKNGILKTVVEEISSYTKQDK